MARPGGSGGGEFGHSAGAVSVYVDPATATVTGEIDEATRPGEWLRALHSSLRFGDHVAPLTELAASWLLISLLTGIWLRWPSIRRSWRAEFSLRPSGTGRARTRRLHSALGLWLTASLTALVLTGLTWTDIAGSRVDVIRSNFSSPAPSLGTMLPGFESPADTGGDHGGHGGHSGHSEAAPADPAAPPFDTAAALAQIDTVATSAAGAGFTAPIKLTPPTADGKAWKVDQIDNRWPVAPAVLAVDGTTGEVVDRVDWDDRPLLSKATSIGIDFHQATLFGIWTQLLLTGIALGLIVVIVLGYRMWWARREPGSFGAPPRAGPLWRVVPIPDMVVFAALCYAMPTLAVSFLVYLALERVWRRLRPAGPPAPAPLPERMPADA